MMTMLAQAGTSGPSFWSVMEHAGLVAALVANVVLGWSQVRSKKEVRRIEPNPLQVEMVKGIAREADCLQRHNDNCQRLQELKHELEEVKKERIEDARAAALSRKGVYDRIDAVRVELSSKMEGMPERIITILRNTGALDRK